MCLLLGKHTPCSFQGKALEPATEGSRECLRLKGTLRGPLPTSLSRSLEKWLGRVHSRQACPRRPKKDGTSKNTGQLNHSPSQIRDDLSKGL